MTRSDRMSIEGERGSSAPFGPGAVTRRQVLRGMAGVAGLIAVPSLLAACEGGATLSPGASTGGSTSASPPAGSLHIGSYHTGSGETAGQSAIDAAFTSATGVQVIENIVDHSTFERQISTYLGATPDTAYTWYSGLRMKSFADKGLTIPIDDVWATVKGNFSTGLADSVVGNDGKVYGIPVDCCPWAVFYRKSLFSEKGYTVPATWDDLVALCQKMQGDGLTPIAFADQEGWPAMGTFDILDLRLNGYDFHVGLLAGKEKWTDPKVAAVFEKWSELLPYQSTDYAGKTWTDAATDLLDKNAGICLLGLFISSVFSATDNPDDLADLDVFPFPTLGTEYDAEKALDAPVDTWSIAAKSPDLTAEQDNAKAYLEFWAQGSTQDIMFKDAPGSIPTANDADTSTYSDVQKKAIEVVAAAQKVAQFLDRDTRSEFAGPQGMQRFLQVWLADPTQDMTAYQQSIQDFWDSLPPLT